MQKLALLVIFFLLVQACLVQALKKFPEGFVQEFRCKGNTLQQLRLLANGSQEWVTIKECEGKCIKAFCFPALESKVSPVYPEPKKIIFEPEQELTAPKLRTETYLHLPFLLAVLASVAFVFFWKKFRPKAKEERF